MPGDDIQGFSSQGIAQSEPFKDKSLALIDGRYHTRTVKGSDASDAVRPADGWYDIVIPKDNPTVIYIRRVKEETEVRRILKEKPGGMPDRGHSSIAPRKEDGTPGDAAFAGTALFEDGELKAWTNKSGHYKIGLGIPQTTTKLVSMSPMKIETVPNEAGRAKLDLLVAMQTGKALADGQRLLPMDRFQPWNGEI